MVFYLDGKTCMVLTILGMVWHIYREYPSGTGYEYLAFMRQDYGV